MAQIMPDPKNKPTDFRYFSDDLLTLPMMSMVRLELFR
jgi:hypothetical protein